MRQLAAMFFGAFSGLLFAPEARAGLFGGAKDPIEDIKNDMEEKKTQEQLELEKRLQAIEDASKGKNARVVVLQWRDTDTDYANENLQRNIKARIARADAQFFPEIDLYQAGRAELDATVRPVDQRARVPDDAVARILAAVEDVASIPWNALSDQDWGLKANELYHLSDEMWFVDRPELREPLFLLFAQIGQAAESSNNPSPPYYENVDGTTVNYFWYLAGSMAYKEPTLLSKITNQSLNASIAFYKDALDSGQFKFVTLNFTLDNQQFDPKAFATDYVVYVNGLEETIKNSNGLLDVPLGRIDIYLKRNDGHSLSDRVDLEKLTDKFYFVRNNARQKMGIDFIEQLMDHPSECIPDIDGKILTYLSIYAKLHPQSEVYIAVPRAGSTAPGQIFLWRWDRARGQLVLVRDNTGGFPVRFAALLSGGLNFSSLQVTVPTADEVEAGVGSQPPTDGDPGALAGAVAPELLPNLDGIPIKYTLRGHYNHLMMAVGIQYKIGNAGNNDTDTPSNLLDDAGKAYYDVYPAHPDDRQLLECVGVGDTTGTTDLTTTTTTTGGNVVITKRPPDDGTTCSGKVGLAYRERNLQRLVFMQAGFMLGRDASSGWGLRGYLQTGWYNVPYAMDLTFHAGYTAKVGKEKPGKKEEDRLGRVRFILDADFYGGFLAGVANSRYRLGEKNILGSNVGIGKPYATFGFDAGAGFTF